MPTDGTSAAPSATKIHATDDPVIRKFFLSLCRLSTAQRHARDFRHFPDRHGRHRPGGLHRPALSGGRLRLPVQPPLRPPRAEQGGLDTDGIPGLHPHVRAVGRIGPHVGSGAAGALPALRGALLPALVHLSAAHARQVEDAARHRPHGHALQHAQRPDAGRLDLLRLARRLLRRLVLPALHLDRRHRLPRGHGHQPPLGLHHPPPAQTGRHAPLHPARRPVPLRHLGQLLRRAARMGGLRHRVVVVGRGGLRLVDLRQPRAARRVAATPLYGGVRRGVHTPRTQAHHPLHPNSSPPTSWDP